MFFSRAKKVKPASEQLVKAACDALQQCERDSSSSSTSGGVSGSGGSSGSLSNSLSALSTHVAQMKAILYGEPDAPPKKEEALELAREVLKTDLLTLLINHLPVLEFECRKDVSQVFSNLLRKHSDGELITVAWVAKHPEVLDALLRGYELEKVALNYGIMLRECVRHEKLAALLLPSEANQSFYLLFSYVESPLFDVASDAFASLKDLLTRHKSRIAQFLDEQYSDFFTHYHTLLRSENYVTKRQSLKLLGEVLLDRTNFTVMTRYISSSDNLKTIMILLRDRSSSIQFEAFHVFKIFVANPNKEKRVKELLLRNKARLLEFMADFQNDKADEQFADEKRFLIDEISRLQRDAPSQPAAAPQQPPATAAPQQPVTANSPADVAANGALPV
mmetsp:Transcript_72473/g.120823  ORF Transcript_72473/g.120823 Transcript_72473/m.120823 type:complete len:391 (+) Transcript_72473:114-1286(+)|eukprot:CAMPEP_0119347632 /NCGR_PEP_ID=MMETSP1333-20130426/108625_1 /TAXON_ID=418940 /ORGANISM="Scyphosphaera apsteinii, Strain RCC1455" /LENGTH=390 /DNA_ID=CAMNT_0007360185 /DNA_START=114 /DNA_END=1286 /DNA_ORIENTATION=+